MEKFKVGDKVKIRDWDDMAKEYGVDINDDIWDIPGVCYYNGDDRDYCGTVVTISAVCKDEDEDYYKIREHLFPVTDAMLIAVGGGIDNGNKVSNW